MTTPECRWTGPESGGDWIVLDIKPSRLELVCHLIAAALAATGVWGSSLLILGKLLLTVLLVALALRGVRRFYGTSSQQLVLDRGHQCLQLVTKAVPIDLTITGWRRLLPLLLVVYYRLPGDSREHHLRIWPDSCDAESRRLLRILSLDPAFG